MHVFGHHIGRQIIVLELDIEQQQIAKRFGREWGSGQQEIEFAKAVGGVCVHMQQRLVHESDGVQLLLRARRHVTQRLFGCIDCAQPIHTPFTANRGESCSVSCLRVGIKKGVGLFAYSS
jgi:hypothetical protein